MRGGRWREEAVESGVQRRKEREIHDTFEDAKCERGRQMMVMMKRKESLEIEE